MSIAERNVEQIIIEPSKGWVSLGLSDLWSYRELAYFLTWRDVKVRYKQTVLGASWAVIQPILTMVVFTIFFGRLGRMETQTTVAYPIFVYAALLPWNFFSQALTQCGQSLLAGANLISKVYFPRLVIPIGAVCAGLVDFAVSFLVLGGLLAYYQIVPTIQILLLVPIVVAMVAASLGIGMLLAALTVAYRDFRYVIPFLVQIWMFISPVAYSLDIVPERWRLLYCVNPLAGVLDGFRSAILGTQINWGCLIVSGISSLICLIVGTVYFRNVERRFADIV